MQNSSTANSKLLSVNSQFKLKIGLKELLLLDALIAYSQ